MKSNVSDSSGQSLEFPQASLHQDLHLSCGCMHVKSILGITQRVFGPILMVVFKYSKSWNQNKTQDEINIILNTHKIGNALI